MKNVDILKTDFTAWQDMNKAAQDYVAANKLDEIAYEDEDGEPMVMFVLPAGSIELLETL